MCIRDRVCTAGCTRSSGQSWDGSENSIYVADDLSVQSAMVYTSEKENDLYSAEGLAEFAKEQIASYNEEQEMCIRDSRDRIPATIRLRSL